MANWNTVQDDFTQGKLSRRFLGRPNDERTRAGLLEAENAFVYPQGPVAKRPGTYFLDSITSPLDVFIPAQMRVWRFIGPNNNDLVAVFYENVVRVYDATTGHLGGSIGPFTQLLPNTQFVVEKKLDNWTYTNIVTLAPGANWRVYWAEYAGEGAAWMGLTAPTGMIGAGSNPWPDIEMSSTVVADTDNEELVCTVRGILFNQLTFSDPTFTVDFALRITINSGATQLATMLYPITEEVEETFQLDHTEVGGLPTGLLTVTVTLEQTFPDPGPTVLQSGSTFDFIVREVELFARPPAGIDPVEFVTTYTNTEVGELHFIQSPYDNRDLLIFHPNHPVQTLHYDGTLPSWVFDEFVFTSEPDEWDVGNYPSIAGAFQGRLIVSGVPSDPEVLWASESGNWTNMDNASPSTKSDPVRLTAQERDINTWILGAKELLYGDKRAERAITSSTILGFDDILIRTQTAYGTLRMPQKIMMGKYAVLATGGKSDLRLAHYSDENGGYVAPNLLDKAETLGRAGFKTHFYSRKPHLILWNIMDDGTILLCHFDDRMEVAAWTEIRTTNTASYIDGCATIDDSGNDIVFLVSRRVVDGEQIFYFETVRDLKSYENWVYTDVTTVYQNAGFVGTVTGFDIYANQEVSVFHDGQYYGNQFVSDSGGLNVTEPDVNTLTVGFPYTFEIQTFPQATFDANSGLTAKKRYSKIGVRTLNTNPPIINGQRPPDRDPNYTMNLSTNPPDLNDVDVVDLNNDGLAIVTIQEPLPLPVMITAIYGKLTSNQL